ncbi:hypothetical protein DL95DRAFT_122359 [Leptodontidium sp. 2 PMI_412]|nr:hypothetical protein DL95DRAFT_122359 [Leptodontidium sp. 2 PMI_412]
MEAHGSTITFFSIPREMRDMVYYLVLARERSNPVVIRSPRRTSAIQKERSAKSVGGILGVNRQIHHEASTVLYSANTFMVGSGPYGSSQEANLHGLKAFTTRIPSRYISLVTHIHLVIYLAWGRPSGAYYFASLGDASDVQASSRALVKHFQGLQSVVVTWAHKQSTQTYLPRLTKEGTVSALIKTVRILLKHPQARKLHIWNDPLSGMMQEVIDNVTATEQLFGKAVKAELMPIQGGSLFGGLAGPKEFHLSWE